MPPESRLQRRIQKAIREAYLDVWLFKVHGGPFQPAGIPDLIGCLCGRFFAFEVKVPGEEPSNIQKLTMTRLKRAGALVAVVTSPEQAVSLLAQLRSSQ
jgi:hypothetical protein